MEELAFAPFLIAMQWWEESYALFWSSWRAWGSSPAPAAAHPLAPQHAVEAGPAAAPPRRRAPRRSSVRAA